MKKLFVFILFLSIYNSFAFDLYSVKLSKNEKLEGTFSINVSNNQSVHLLFIKDSETKKFVIKPLFLNQTKVVKELESYTLDSKPNIIANHYLDNNFVISNYDEDSKKLTVIEFDLITGKFKDKIVENYLKPKIIFNQNGKTYLINLNTENQKQLRVDVIINTNQIVSSAIKLDPNFYKKFKSVINDSPDVINQEVFVKNGSIKKNRVYLNDDNLYFTNENNDKTTSLFTFNLNDKTSATTIFDFNLDNKTKDFNSYVFADKLMNVTSKYDDIDIKYFDLKTSKLIKELSLNTDLKSLFNNDKIQNFLNEEKKPSLKITSTINSTKDNNYKITISRVNINDYNYNYNWWWFQSFMMQQMQMQQMMQMSARGGFGPKNDYNDIYISEKRKPETLEFVVNNQFEIQASNNVSSVFKNIDKDEIIKEFEKDKSIKNFTATFLEDELIYVYQNNKSKEIFINFKKFD